MRFDYTRIQKLSRLFTLLSVSFIIIKWLITKIVSKIAIINTRLFYWIINDNITLSFEKKRIKTINNWEMKEKLKRKKFIFANFIVKNNKKRVKWINNSLDVFVTNLLFII